MTEHTIQCHLFSWARAQAGRYPSLDLMFAIPNGGDRHRIVAAKLKGEGVKAGVPDIFLPVARGEHHGLFIEMKTEKGRVRTVQRAWLDALANQGYLTLVCRSFDEARDAILDYITS